MRCSWFCINLTANLPLIELSPVFRLIPLLPDLSCYKAISQARVAIIVLLKIQHISMGIHTKNETLYLMTRSSHRIV